jgi:hypothetical protein
VRRERETYAADNGHEVERISLWETTRRIHFMNEERDVTGSEFLDEEVRKKIVIACKVEHVHDLCRTPFGPGGLLVSRGHERRWGGRGKRNRKQETRNIIMFFLGEQPTVKCQMSK